jgi:ribonuclease BN (tRNA processing enzyme)
VTSRRQFIQATTVLALGWTGSACRFAGQARGGTRLVLLGTKGGPRVTTGERSNPSTLILVEGVPIVVDCGYGTAARLVAAGVRLDQLRYVFITHHHSDHTLDYGPLVYSGWVAGLATRVDAYGPPGMQALTDGFFEYMRADIEVRIEDEGRADLRDLLVPHGFDGPGIVLETPNMRVTAARVLHPPIADAYAYRFDTDDRSIVISGDTTYSPALIELARGADVLVHETLYVPGLEGLLARVRNAQTLREHLVDSHTTTEDVGRVAQAAEVRTLVLSHLVPGEDPSITDEQWTEGVRRYYDGEIIVGRDLMEI